MLASECIGWPTIHSCSHVILYMNFDFVVVYRHIIAGLFFNITIVMMQGPNKYFKPQKNQTESRLDTKKVLLIIWLYICLKEQMVTKISHWQTLLKTCKLDLILLLSKN